MVKKREPKERASFTFDKKTIEILDKLMELDEYRNKSHIVENAIKILEKEKLNNKKGKKNGA